MKREARPFQSSIAGFFEDFLRYHRALGKRFDTEERALRMFDRYLLELEVRQITEITPAILQAFVNSRRRPIAKVAAASLSESMAEWADSGGRKATRRNRVILDRSSLLIQ